MKMERGRRRQSIAVLSVTALMALGATGCGDDDGEPEIETETEVPEIETETEIPGVDAPEVEVDE